MYISPTKMSTNFICI